MLKMEISVIEALRPSIHPNGACRKAIGHNVDEAHVVRGMCRNIVNNRTAGNTHRYPCSIYLSQQEDCPVAMNQWHMFSNSDPADISSRNGILLSVLWYSR